jgi:hypothetical protein
MSDLAFLDQYSGQTLDELIALAGTHRIDSLVLAIEAALIQRIARESTPVAREERVILAIEALEREVNNGGFDQFFRNSSRAYTSDVVLALRAAGCPQTAAIAERAIAALQIAGELSEETLDEALDTGDEELENALLACDELYYAASEDIASALFAFVRTNRDRIRLR